MRPWETQPNAGDTKISVRYYRLSLSLSLTLPLPFLANDLTGVYAILFERDIPIQSS